MSTWIIILTCLSFFQFGHPGNIAREGTEKELRPLRVSWGIEKGTEGAMITYDNDTLPGNSGSPVIARVVNGQAYRVKGIHVKKGREGEEVNKAMMLRGAMSYWEKPP